MLCPAAVSAAAAAVWLLAVLGPGLSLPAEDNSEPGLCSQCFYRQTPPQGGSAGPLLSPRCHTLPGGQAFATLSRPNCDTAVYSAFHLAHGWTEREGEKAEELVTEDKEDIIKIAVLALLRGDGDLSPSFLPTDSPLQHWDATVTTFVQSTITSQCSTLGGDLYILTGAGVLGAAEDGDKKCQLKPLWSAVCCAVPEGKNGFSVGLISETGDGEKQVSVKELEELLGVAELFSEGCGGADGKTVGITVGLHHEGPLGNTEELESDPAGENTEVNDVDSNTADGITEGEEAASDATSQDPNEDIKDSSEAVIAGEQEAGVNAQPQEAGVDAQPQEAGVDAQPQEAGVDAQPGEADVAEVTQKTSEASVTSERSSGERRDTRHSGAARSESSESSGDPDSSPDYKNVNEQETDTNSSSIVVYILSTTMSILKAPLRPVFSTITQLPGQVTYVLQEDLGVLSALPGDTFSLFHLLTSDLLSWMGSAAEMLLGIGETCFFSVYYCTSSMLGALLSSCHTGVTGMGTLVGDTVGIFGDVFDNGWWVTKFFGGRLWEQSEGYVGTVMSEMGGQAKAVGGGLGRLAWRSGNGVGNVFRLGGGLIMGVVDMVIGAIRGAFGEESG